jgi:alanine-glyoxylate transaminase/serine-glyoxylate transaminase/serine-pyruvate transaminase
MQKPIITSFIPPHRTLMGPGPSDVPQRVLDATSTQRLWT